MLPTLPKALFKRMCKLANSMSIFKVSNMFMCLLESLFHVFDVCNETVVCSYASMS